MISNITLQSMNIINQSQDGLNSLSKSLLKKDGESRWSENIFNSILVSKNGYELKNINNSLSSMMNLSTIISSRSSSLKNILQNLNEVSSVTHNLIANWSDDAKNYNTPIITQLMGQVEKISENLGFKGLVLDAYLSEKYGLIDQNIDKVSLEEVEEEIDFKNLLMAGENVNTIFEVSNEGEYPSTLGVGFIRGRAFTINDTISDGDEITINTRKIINEVTTTIKTVTFRFANNPTEVTDVKLGANGEETALNFISHMHFLQSSESSDLINQFNIERVNDRIFINNHEHTLDYPVISANTSVVNAIDNILNSGQLRRLVVTFSDVMDQGKIFSINGVNLIADNNYNLSEMKFARGATPQETAQNLVILIRNLLKDGSDEVKKALGRYKYLLINNLLGITTAETRDIEFVSNSVTTNDNNVSFRDTFTERMAYFTRITFDDSVNFEGAIKINNYEIKSHDPDDSLTKEAPDQIPAIFKVDNASISDNTSSFRRVIEHIRDTDIYNDERNDRHLAFNPMHIIQFDKEIILANPELNSLHFPQDTITKVASNPSFFRGFYIPQAINVAMDISDFKGKIEFGEVLRVVSNTNINPAADVNDIRAEYNLSPFHWLSVHHTSEGLDPHHRAVEFSVTINGELYTCLYSIGPEPLLTPNSPLRRIYMKKASESGPDPIETIFFTIPTNTLLQTEQDRTDFIEKIKSDLPKILIKKKRFILTDKSKGDILDGDRVVGSVAKFSSNISKDDFPLKFSNLKIKTTDDSITYEATIEGNKYTLTESIGLTNSNRSEKKINAGEKLVLRASNNSEDDLTIFVGDKDVYLDTDSAVKAVERGWREAFGAINLDEVVEDEIEEVDTKKYFYELKDMRYSKIFSDLNLTLNSKDDAIEFLNKVEQGIKNVRSEIFQLVSYEASIESLVNNLEVSSWGLTSANDILGSKDLTKIKEKMDDYLDKIRNASLIIINKKIFDKIINKIIE